MLSHKKPRPIVRKPIGNLKAFIGTVALGNPKALSRNLSSQYGYLREYQSVQRLVRGKVVETQNHFLRDLHRFEQATGMNPDQFLAYAEAHKSVEVVDLIDK